MKKLFFILMILTSQIFGAQDIMFRALTEIVGQAKISELRQQYYYSCKANSHSFNLNKYNKHLSFEIAYCICNKLINSLEEIEKLAVDESLIRIININKNKFDSILNELCHLHVLVFCFPPVNKTYEELIRMKLKAVELIERKIETTIPDIIKSLQTLYHLEQNEKIVRTLYRMINDMGMALQYKLFTLFKYNESYVYACILGDILKKKIKHVQFKDH